MKKNKLSNIFMLVLLLSSYISALVTISPSVSTAAKDITNLVDITGCEVTKNGHEINDENKIVKGDTIHIKYFWEVSKENMDGVEAGDSFTLSLPDPTYFGGYGDEGPYDLDNPYDGPSLGKYSLIGNNFVVEINEEGAKQDVLADGWLSVDVKALKAGTNIDGGGNGAVTIPKLEITDPGGGEGHDPDDEAFPDDQLPFHKKGKQNHGQNSINWSFVVNNQGLNELIETYSANQESGLNNKIIPRENGLLIDKLDPGMKFQDGSLFVTIPVQIINSEGHMGTRFVKGTNNLQIQDQFIRVYPQEGEEYEDFQNRVRNYPTENGSLAYGVYTDSENRDTVFVAFGNMPGDHALYNEVHAGAIANAIMNDDTLSQEQKEALQTIYCDLENSPGGGGIVAYGLSFNADVQVGEGYGNGIYANKAQFIWGEDGSEEDEWDTHFHQIGGSVTGEFIQVEKEVEGTGALVKPRHFEFEIVDQADPTNPIAYGITDKEVTQKGERVKVNFYKNKSSQAEYTNEIDGNGEVNGWRSVLTDGHSYLIREIGSPEYSPLITGGTGEGDQYDYNANIEKRTQFLILNQTTIDLQAKKIVTGTANLSTPTVFTFQLKHEGSPVAYGKTTVTEKDKEFPIDFYTSANFEEESRVTDWKKILTPGEQYTLEEIDTNGYQPKYSHRQGDSGEYSSGNTITVASEETSSYQFLVDNQKEKPKPIEVSLEAEKKLTGRELKDKDFSFELFDSNGQLIDTKENDGSSIKFKKLSFDQTGTYKYSIKEKVGNEVGMTYDGKTVMATINISESDNKLKSTVTYTDDDAKENTANQFENTFKEKPKPIEVLLEAEKKLTGRELKDKDFSFKLFDSNGQLIDTKENDGSSIKFKKLSFDQAGTHVYTIKEKAGNEVGMTYDGKTVTATIEITEKDDKLESKITYTDDDAKENTANQFENTFKEKPKPIEVSLEAEKKLTGRELKDQDFSFELFDSAEQLIETKENDGSSIEFKKLTFDQTGTYVYTIKEKAGNEAGMTYDGKTVTATIEITEKGDQLESKVTYSDDDAKENTANQFENSFKEKPKPIDVSLEAQKKLTGRELKDNDFSFKLFDSNGQLIDTKENDGSSIKFKKLTFDQAGTHVYTIKEKAGNEVGMTYDGKTVTATINISESDNKLKSTVTYTDDDAKENTANQFENSFKEKPKPIEVLLEAEKKLTGRELKDKDFSFELFDSEGQLIDTKENDGSSIKFKKLSFDQTGTYVYTIKEKAGNEVGMTYDGKTVTATINISESDNKLKSTVTYTDDDAKENTANQFENSFKEKPKPIEVLLEAEKKLTGRELKDKDFSFELFDSEGQLIDTKENDGSAIKFKKLTFDQAGTHVYTIKEKAGNEAGMTYDGKTVTATIEITEKGDQLESKITYTDDDAEENIANEFLNIYNEEPPTGGFLIRKVDTDSNEPLANAAFHVFDAEMQRIREDEVIQTDEDGVVKVNDLPFGDYYVVEAHAPEGYLIEDEPMKVSIHEESHEERNMVTNRDPKIKTGITLTKIDSATGEKLKGAEFLLRNAQNEPVDLGRKLITDENGLIHIDSLPAGEYSLVESNAPEGYQLDSEPLTFTAAEDNKLVELTKKNTVELTPKKIPEPKATPTSLKKYPASSSQTSQATPSSTSKQYPKLNVVEQLFLTLVGWGVVGGIWLYRKKK